MALDPITMMMVAQGAGKVAQAGSRLFQPKFNQTRYGKLLRNRQKQGNLSSGQEMNVLGRTATTATKQANLANKRYMGSLMNRGMQGSVSAQRGLREAEADVRRTVADTGKDIYQSEEQAKSKAKLDYAKLMDQDKAERRQAGMGVVSAVADTAMQYAGQKAQQQQAQDQSYMDAVSKYGRDAVDLPGIPGGRGQYTTPSGQIRYTGEGLTQDDKRSVDVYAQKANIKNSTAVSDTFESYLSGETDANKFLEKMTGLGLSDEQIIELMKQLSQ
jgi:hypothetical protein